MQRTFNYPEPIKGDRRLKTAKSVALAGGPNAEIIGISSYPRQRKLQDILISKILRSPQNFPDITKNQTFFQVVQNHRVLSFLHLSVPVSKPDTGWMLDNSGVQARIDTLIIGRIFANFCSMVEREKKDNNMDTDVLVFI